MNLPGIVAILIAILVGFTLLLAGARARQIGGICLLFAFGSAGYFVLRDQRIASRDSQISVGDSEERVLSLLGSPTTLTDCSTGYGGYKRGVVEMREISPDCAQELWYYSFYFPQSFTYTFNRERKLIGKYELNSP